MTPAPRPPLVALFQHAADAAAAALSAWVARPATIVVRDVEILPLGTAAGALGHRDEPIACAAMQVEGALGGILVLAASDAAGWALADLLIGRGVGSATDWGDVERSATLETANIVGCAYLGALAAALAASGGDGGTEAASGAVLPSPPLFLRDYAPAVMEGLVADQASLADSVFIARSAFSIDGVPVRCALVFVPDADTRLRIVDDGRPRRRGG